MTYIFLQHYWWFVVSLLGAILVFLMIVQGANSQLSIGATEMERRMIVNSTGRKWEFTFTTLVTFGGAFFASFPLFYSTSFGGAYWLWMAILFTFMLQAVSYEFQNKIGNVFGPRAYQWFLIINGVFAPLLLGAAVATFFTGSNFIVEKNNIISEMQPVISRWANASHGLDAFCNPWNIVFGIAVLFLSRALGNLYIINNIANENIRSVASVRLVGNFLVFLLTFLAFLVYVLVKDGYAVDAQTGEIVLEPYKYLHNLLDMWYVALAVLAGVVAVLYGVGKTIFSKTYIRGIWPAGIGVVVVVTGILLCAGWNDTAFYPSTADLQSSLTMSNSCSSEFTLRTMAVVSILVPFVLAYIFYAWRKIDSKEITAEEILNDESY